MKMKWMTIFVIIISCILAGCKSNSVINWNNKPEKEPEPIEMEFTFIKTSPYDSASLRKMYETGPAVPILYWSLVDSWKHLYTSAEEQDFIPPDEFDFENYCLFITYGRKLAALERIDSYYNIPALIVTFEEEEQGDNLFIYSIEKRNYVPWYENYTSVYVMMEGERVSLGWHITYINGPGYFLRDKELTVKLGDGSSGLIHEYYYEERRDELDEIRKNWTGLPGWCSECDEKFVLPDGTKIKIIEYLDGWRFLILDGDIHVGEEAYTSSGYIFVML